MDGAQLRKLVQQASFRMHTLDSNTVLRGLPVETLQILAHSAKVTWLGKGSPLWRQGDVAGAVYCIAAGHLLEERVNTHGQMVYFNSLHPGQLLGHDDLTGDLTQSVVTRATTVNARVDSAVLVLDNGSVLRAMETDVELARRLIGDLGRTIRRLKGELFQERVIPGKQHLAGKLVHLAAVEGVVQGSLSLGYSQAELALFTGLRARTIHKLLREIPAVQTVRGRTGVHIECLATLRYFARWGDAEYASESQ